VQYKEAIDYLYSLRLFGAKFGLENTLRLAELAGDPQQHLRFIHVAGTNGKGSTCAMLEGIYRATGLRTGLFTSPHLVSFCERLQVNRIPIAEDDVAPLVANLKALAAQFPRDHHPTFFEMVTVMALIYFTEQKCDLVLWETGLGGRLDATNIVMPMASVITNVQFDHQQWLGDSIEKIAFEKAGIIKPGVPVITGADASPALDVIEKTATARGAPLTVVHASANPLPSGISLPLLGNHQRLNAAVTIATVQALQKTISVSEVAVRSGLESVQWPGRLQLAIAPSGRRILLDGAHNVDAALALRQAVGSLFPKPLDAIIIGMLRDKDCEQMCRIIAPLSQRICVVQVESDRTAALEMLAQFCSAANPGAQVSMCASLADALEWTEGASVVLLTGSLYLVGQALELLHLIDVPPLAERSLNDWSGIQSPSAPSR